MNAFTWHNSFQLQAIPLNSGINKVLSRRPYVHLSMRSKEVEPNSGLVKELRMPGFEPGISRPQREVLTTILHTPRDAGTSPPNASAPFQSLHTPKRTGLLAVKIGMISVWDFYGVAHGCTVLQVEECQVTQVKTSDIHGFDALQLGVGLRKPRNVVKPLMGHLKKAGVAPKRQLQEFRVSQEGVLPAGTTLNATHFVPGQFVDVCGIRYAKNQRRLRD
ncbi:hypothetical protein ABG067_006557 [Albugo candida]